MEAMLSIQEVVELMGCSRQYVNKLAKSGKLIGEKAEISSPRFRHSLASVPKRPGFATVALQSGVDVKTVSSMLGHYDPGFTLRTYTHATRQKQEEAAETIGNFMSQVM